MLFHVIVINGIYSPFQLFNKFVLLKEEDQNTYEEHLVPKHNAHISNFTF